MTGNNINNKGEHKIFLLLLLFLAVAMALFFYTAKKKINQQIPAAISIEKPAHPKNNQPVGFTDGATIKMTVGEAEITAEVAKSDAKKSTGLGGREKLGAGEGMLFVFDGPSKYSFWNKDMLFPIDIIWIKDGVAVDVSENMPNFKTSPNYTVTPRTEANFVLEVNAGFVKEKNIKAGAKVSFN